MKPNRGQETPRKQSRMGRIWKSRPSPALIVTSVAVALAVAGTAIAGPTAINALTKPEVRKIARAEAKRQIQRKAPGLEVGYADEAGFADEAGLADEAADADSLGGQGPSSYAQATSEPYHEVGKPGEPSFLNNWHNVGGNLSTTAFYEDSLGVVHLKGSLSGGSNGTTAFTLPDSDRPGQTLVMPMAQFSLAGPTAEAGFLLVQSDGDVAPACNNPCIVGIDGLTFRAG
jgi:hypothetical protein